MTVSVFAFFFNVHTSMSILIIHILMLISGVLLNYYSATQRDIQPLDTISTLLFFASFFTILVSVGKKSRITLKKDYIYIIGILFMVVLAFWRGPFLQPPDRKSVV